jgi:hypothetical protein
MKRAQHPTQQELEQFVLGRLGPPDDPAAARVEQHLLVCSFCVNMAEHALEFAQAIRQALQTGKAKRDDCESGARAPLAWKIRP